MLVLHWGQGCGCPQSSSSSGFQGKVSLFQAPLLVDPVNFCCWIYLVLVSRKTLLALGSAFRTVSPHSPRRASLITPPSVSLLLTPVRTCCLDSPQACKARLRSSSWTLNLWTSSLWVGVRPTPTL